MSAKFDTVAGFYKEAAAKIAAAQIEMAQQMRIVGELDFNAVTLGRHYAAMSKVQTLARVIVEMSVDAQVECTVAGEAIG